MGEASIHWREFSRAFVKQGASMKIKTHSILSEREQQLCWFAVRGLKYRDIGKQLGLTEATVGVYMHQILRKTGYRRRIDLILNHTP